MLRRCLAVTALGSQCANTPLPLRRVCRTHSAKLAKTHPPLDVGDLATIDDVRDALRDLARAVLEHRIDLGRASIARRLLHELIAAMRSK